ncbi:MAG: tetratricopeptide repeat protein [Deltaproteobacteria bacterium]
MIRWLSLFLFLFCNTHSLTAQERPRAALAPVGALDVPTAQQLILFNRLQDRLSTRYDLVSQTDFASAQDEVFASLTTEECTEENCIRLIQEFLQVEDYFHLQLVRSGNDIQLTLTVVDLDKRQVRSDYCESCEQRELNQRLDTLITSLLPQVENDLQAEMEQNLERQAAEARQKQEDARLQQLQQIVQLLQSGSTKAGASIDRYRANDSTNRFTPFFEKQDPKILYKLGEIYRRGQGLDSNPTEAFRWHTKAAEKNHAPSQSMLGYLYRNGIGTAENSAQAVNWYRRAADQNYALAQFNLGSLYRKGYGVPQDEARARALYQQAAKNGNPQARKVLDWLAEQ